MLHQLLRVSIASGVGMFTIIIFFMFLVSEHSAGWLLTELLGTIIVGGFITSKVLEKL